MKGGTPMPEPRNSLNWDVTEGGHHEQWTRDDEGGKDEQKFIHCDSQQEIKVHYVGDKVYIELKEEIYFELIKERRYD